MPVRDPACTSNKPPQIAVIMPGPRVIAAQRSEPGVWAVPLSNSAGLTIWIAVEGHMESSIDFEVVE
jgi:hypothetical protein